MVVTCVLYDNNFFKFRTGVDVAIRKFSIPPSLHLGANSIQELSNLAQARTEPPLTARLSHIEILELAGKPLAIELPCHTQAVEFHVPMVTSASASVADRGQREGYVRNIKTSRAKNPTINHKRDFVL